MLAAVSSSRCPVVLSCAHNGGTSQSLSQRGRREARRSAGRANGGANTFCPSFLPLLSLRSFGTACQYELKSHSAKVRIKRERFTNSMLPHERKRGAIGETELLIGVLFKDLPRGSFDFGIDPNNREQSTLPHLFADRHSK
jgi:hypothetical protein